MAKFVIKLLLVATIASCVLGQYQYQQPYTNNINNVFNGCDFFETIELGRVYDVFSPYYPEKYAPGTNCRWSGCSPYGTNIVIKCKDVRIPTYGQCDQFSDRLEVSYQGCQELTDVTRYCTQPFTTETKSNALVMALRSYTNSTGGGFFCQIHAQPAPLPALQPVSPSRFISSGQSFPQRSVSYVPVQQTSQQYVPVYQSGFQPSYQPGYSQQTYQSGSRGQQSYQSPYYVQGSYRPVPVSQSQPQPQPQPPTQVQASPQSRPSFQPAYQQPGYQPVYQQSYPASSSTIQQSQPPAYNGYQSGFSSGYQNGFQNTYQSGYQPNGIPSERKPGYPVVSSYTPQQPVYQPLGPQGQTQCQTQCGLRKKPRILNGESVDIEQMPFTCGLMDLNTKTVFCDGSIISPNFIITVAHCVYNRTINTIGVIVGTTDYARPTESRYAATYRLFGVIVHPDYEPISMLNDIAIAKTGPIEFNPAVAPVCLPISDRLSQQTYAYSPVEVVGYGEEAYTAPASTRLKSVVLNVITNEQCNDNYPYRITASQMCLLTPRKDTCTGDDGAGLCHVDTVTGRLVLVGMPSYGVGCGTRQPRVACRVSSYISWIRQVTNEDYCVI